MDAEEIDELNKDYSRWMNYMYESQLQNLFKKHLKDKIPEDYEEGMKAIMMKIENGDYDYFWKLITEEHSALINIMRFSSKTDDIKSLIENRKNLDLKLSTVMELIIATHDSGYIKHCIKNREEYGFSPDNLQELIIATHDPAYIESCIENRKNLGLENSVDDLFGNTVNYTYALILSTGNIEKYIGEEAEYGKKYGLAAFDVKKLILESTDINPEFIKTCIENREKYGFKSFELNELIIATHDQAYIESCIENRKNLGLENSVDDLFGNTVNYTYALILSTGNIEKYIGEEAEYGKKYGLDERDVKRLILESIDSNPEFIKTCIENRGKYGFSSFELKTLIIATHDPAYIETCIENRKNLGLENFGYELILATGNIEKYIREETEYGKKYGLDELDVRGLILESINSNPEFIDSNPELIRTRRENSEKYGFGLFELNELIIATLLAKGNIEKYIGEEAEYGKKYGLDAFDVKELILKSTDINPEFIKTCIENREQYGFSPDDVQELILVTGDVDYIANYIGEKIEEPEDKIKITIENMLKVNAQLFKNIDINLFKTKYIEILGEDKVNQISCYPKVQKQILRLDEKQLCILGKCLDVYMRKNETEEWTPLASSILKKIEQFDKLLSNIDDIEDLTEEDIEKLSIVLQSDNFFSIEYIYQLRDFDKIREEDGGVIIRNEMQTLENKKEALLFKMFGHDTDYAETIIRKYGEDIESIEDCDVKYYVKALIEIKKISDPELIKKIFESCECVTINLTAIERKLKDEYWMQYNEILYSLNEQDKLTDEETSTELGISVEQFEKMPEIYLLSGKSEFNILMTSVGSFSKVNPTKDYRAHWNMRDLSTQHFCASYIREDMLGTAPIESICYGFEPMENAVLTASGSVDMFSSTGEMVSKASHDEVYYSPDEQINHTLLYNEMDIRRMQCGRKLQPSYILVFKRNGSIDNMQEALRASKDWGGMPIVVIDVDSCLKIQKKKVESMINDYNENPTIEQARAIIQKVRNNKQTNYRFCMDLEEKLTELESKIQEEEITQENQGEDERIQENQGDGEELQVSEENMRKFYDETSAIERKKEMGTIKKIYDKIKNIVKESEKDD